jgi:hypothetical protein
MNTRVGEGFQQEVAKMYVKTNGKNAEHQVCTPLLHSSSGLKHGQICALDENEESMARLKMAIDEWRQSQTEIEELDLIDSAHDSAAHWKLGSQESRVSPHSLETSMASSPAFRSFNMRLREYLAHHHPSHAVQFEDEIKVKLCLF